MKKERAYRDVCKRRKERGVLEVRNVGGSFSKFERFRDGRDNYLSLFFWISPLSFQILLLSLLFFNSVPLLLYFNLFASYIIKFFFSLC